MKWKWLFWFCIFIFLIFFLLQAFRIGYILKISTSGIEDLKFRTKGNHDFNKNIRIPNIVHQIWKDENISTYPIRNSQESWKRRYPNYEVKLWTEEKIRQLIKKEYNWLYPTYLSYRYNIQRADVARYVVLHWDGGIYADLDAFPTNNTLDIWRDAQLVLPETSDGTTFSNHFLMAEKNSPFLQYALSRLKSHNQYIILPYLRVFWSTGPLFIGYSAREWISENSEFDLVVLRDKELQTYVKHLAGRSWHGWDGKLLSWFGDNLWITKLLPTVIQFVFLGLMCTFIYKFYWKRTKNVDQDPDRTKNV